jgi:hypothetical protein
MILNISLAVLLVTFCGEARSAGPTAIRPRVEYESGWWPTQAMPKAPVANLAEDLRNTDAAL